MYNFHSHTLLSDGCLVPSELAARYADKGYKAIAITDHVDASNIDFVISCVTKFCFRWPKSSPIQVLPGIELTHLPLEQFQPMARLARKKGIKVVIGHGQTEAEPVVKGTNFACLKAGVDILAHPGFITDQEAKLAASRGIFLELTTRKGHSSTNAHVCRQALRWGAKMVFSHDSHDPADIISSHQTETMAAKAGLNPKAIGLVWDGMARFCSKKS